MHISAGPYTYEWIEDWAKLPPSSGFSHHGMAVAPDGNLFVGDVTEPRVHVLKPDGTPLQSFDLPISEVHGLSIAQEDHDYFLWVVDNGDKAFPSRSAPGNVMKCMFDGTIVKRYFKEDLGYTEDMVFRPTACAFDPDTGYIWITDGYGSQRVTCLDADDKIVLSFDGRETQAGKHSTPHWIWVDRRKGHSEIYLADRANDRVLVYATDGTLLRNLNEGFRRPSGFAAFDDVLVVAELAAGIVLLDKHDDIIARIGTHREAMEREGWPNAHDAEGNRHAPTEHLTPGYLNSPHGVAADSHGNIYVSEWLLGGRYICLKKQ